MLKKSIIYLLEQFRFRKRRASRNARYRELGRQVQQFLKTSEYREGSLNQLISYYCESGGRSNDLLHEIVCGHRGKLDLEAEQGILKVGQREKDSIVRALDQDGFCVLPERISKDVCNGLKDIALNREATLFPPLENGPVSAILDRNNPLAAGYFFHSDVMLNERLAQDLVSDPSFLSIAQAYLGCAPTLNTVNLWWSLPSNEQRDISHLAQEFHFDMDRIKWLKIFVYVNDVDQSNGAHWFVRGSHRTGCQPIELLARGYARIPDADIRKHYSDNDILCFEGKAGTVILEDTRGFHRGSPVINGERLMFEIDYSDCLFGAPAPVFRVNKLESKQFKSCRERYPTIFERLAI